MREKLRVGILLNSYLVPSWEYHIVEQLVYSDRVDIVLVIKNKSGNLLNGEERKGISRMGLRLLEKTDRFIFKRKNDYNNMSDAQSLFIKIPEIDIDSASDLSSDSLTKNLADIAEYNIDIILMFGIHKLTSEISKLAKYGILKHSIDSEKSNGISDGFWEVVRKNPVTHSSIVILKEKSEEVIFNSWESTCPFSINVNRNHLFWRASLFIPRILYGLYESGDTYLERQKNKFKSNNTAGESIPSPSFVTGDFVNYLTTGLKTVYKKLKYTDAFNWHLLIDLNNKMDNLLPDFSKFKSLISPEGIFWADPFVVAENDNYYIFVEEFLHKTKKAHISVLTLDNKGSFLNSTTIIERPYHMSYPFIFKIDSVFYMIPETNQNKTIELYKCTEFPFKWEFDRNIMENLSAVDTTLFFQNNKWWLFTSIDQTNNISGNSTELFLFFTEDFFSGEWISHPDNPVVSDVRTGRSAGKIFTYKGKIYRPSQDCSGRYGKGFKLNHITKLTEIEYIENIVAEVEPYWDENFTGTHTFNFEKDFTIIDVYSYRKRFKV